MKLVELDRVGEQQWRELIGEEREPWGGLAEDLVWADKQRHVGIRAPDGRLLAVAGAVLADVAVEGAGQFPVLGIGGVFVARSARGRGFVAPLVERLLAPAAEVGPERAMLFCRAHVRGLYRKLGFEELRASVWAEQPSGRIEMPLRAMWRALRGGVTWPPGRVDVRGLPF
jgi:predicted GNAT family N-acyltransferase